MSLLYLIRHAMPLTSQYDNRFPGPGLGDLGRTQSAWIRDQLRDFGITQVFASDFTRVIETMRPTLLDLTTHKVQYPIALREREPAEETHESLVARVQHWWNENKAAILATNTAIFSHCGPLNMILEILDPHKQVFAYPYTCRHGCHTPIAGIWRIQISQDQIFGQLIPCPIQ